jgi:hypothetical protein
MKLRHIRLSALAFSLLPVIAAACASLQAKPSTNPAQEWPRALATAQGRVGDAKFDAADSILADFATRFPGTSQALETAYWRSIFRLDPTNPRGSVPNAMAALDGYLADPRPRQHTIEAATLRRIAGQLDGLNHVAATAVAQAKDATNTAKDAKAEAADARDAAAKASDTPPTADAEIKRLKDELAKANA